MSGEVSFVLHSWTVDQAPLADLPGIARAAGWDGLELRPVDFARAAELGIAEAEAVAALQESGVPVACHTASTDWITADGDAGAGLAAFVQVCRRAQLLGAPRLMSRVHFAAPPTDAQAAAFRSIAGVAADHGLRLALEFDSAAAQVNALGSMRALIAAIDHPGCGLLLDTYHLARSGAQPQDIGGLAAVEVAYVQFSDSTLGRTQASPLDRLAPGLGEFALPALIAAIQATGYAGPMSFEAPHRDSWRRPPHEVAYDGLLRSRAMLQAPA
jgi:4-hydroxyphenylpyruvate dioxygenase